jgi:tetratricopeptide (TPR) repeat protein
MPVNFPSMAEATCTARVYNRRIAGTGGKAMTRKRNSVAGLLFSLVTGLTGAQAQVHDPRAIDADPATATAPIAPRLDGLGNHRFPITTDSEDAQYFFDQGLRLTYGFNHSEALRAFKEAVRLDPDNAMAHWGWALVLGPNLNLPMLPEVVPQAHSAIQKAVELKNGVSAKERDMIDALALRYTDDPEADRASFDQAYSDALGSLVARYPDDLDIATLYAASLMNLSPWNYWDLDGRARDNTDALVATLQSVVERDPNHPGALHYYIHAVEARHPEWAESGADRLGSLMPGAGHMVHMPSHIYMRLGRYADSYAANEKASAADERYITQCRAQGLYPLGYYPHNVHFLAWSAMFQGRSDAAMAASRKVADKVPADLGSDTWLLYQTFLAQPMYTMVRFGRWDEALAESRPPDEALYMNGVWHYARGLAYKNTGQSAKAVAELERLRTIRKDPTAEEQFVGFGPVPTLLLIAELILEAEIAAGEGRMEEAISRLGRAVRLEDALLYNEPPDWYFPVRHYLGAALLDGGYPAEAEVVYWQDLRKNRNNGFALFGLMQALEAQDKAAALYAIEERFDAAWADADVELTSSRF